MFTIPVILLSAALFLAMMLNLVLKPSFSARVTTVSMVIAVFGGLLIYGIGFSEATGTFWQAIVRTAYSVIGIFLGKNELPAISGTSVVSTPGLLVLFWLVHMLGFYSTASAFMITIGAHALRQLRFLLSRRGDLTLIYGVNENCLALGRECHADGRSVVFVTRDVSGGLVRDINNMGMTVMTGQAAVNSEDRFIRRLRVRSRRLTVYALDEQKDQNLFYALRLKAALERAGIAPEKTQITLPGAEDIISSMLQVSEDSYGFGYVNVFDPALLAARALIQICPPWESLTFTSDGRAAENFHCVVVGFGHYGQAALRQLLLNGQFAGSRFRAEIFAPAFRSEAGNMMVFSPELMKQYELHFSDEEARSVAFYEYLDRNLKSIKLIAVCTGNESLDSEISDNLMLYLMRRKAEEICVVQCGKKGARYQQAVGSPIHTINIYSLAMLSAERADKKAIILNGIYDASDRSLWDKWVACDSFSKMSSRAAADFLPAFIRASGSSEEEILAGNWAPDEKLLQVLGETEHRRWCAFHYAMGYSRMSDEELQRNAETYARCRAEGKPCSIKIAKNQQAHTHACLIPWEALDALSEKENAITGRGVNYKQADINNVLALPQILRAERKDDAAK